MSQNEAPESKPFGIEESVILKHWPVWGGVLLIWLLSPFAIDLALLMKGRGFFVDAGAVGDVFGAINALFSGLAFAFIVITLNLQRQELSLQHQELRNQIEEMKKQREELAHQHEEMTLQREEAKIQRFNSMFFSLLAHKQKALELTGVMPESASPAKHVAAIAWAVRTFNEPEFTAREIWEVSEIKAEHIKTHINSKANACYRHFSIYFSSIISLLSIFDFTDIPEEIKASYMEIAKKNMNPWERYFLILMLASDRDNNLSRELCKLKFSESDIRAAAAQISTHEHVKNLFVNHVYPMHYDVLTGNN